MDIIFKMYLNLELQNLHFSVFSCIICYIHQGNILDVLIVSCQSCTYIIHAHNFVLFKSCITCYTYQGYVLDVLTVFSGIGNISAHSFVLCKSCITFYKYQGNVLDVLTGLSGVGNITAHSFVLCKVALPVNTYQGNVLNVFYDLSCQICKAKGLHYLSLILTQRK
jgi:hypothetical protein